MPPKFIHVFGTDLVRQIIDCTEIQMQKASEPMAARCCWSEYKHRYTAKILAGVTPNGAFSYVSDAYGGRISDPQIVKHSGWLDTVEVGDKILADKGFLIDDQLAEKGASVITPPKKTISYIYIGRPYRAGGGVLKPSPGVECGLLLSRPARPCSYTTTEYRISGVKPPHLPPRARCVASRHRRGLYYGRVGLWAKRHPLPKASYTPKNVPNSIVRVCVTRCR